jgi:hypothetical protein
MLLMLVGRTGKLIEPNRFPDEDRPLWGSGSKKEVERF